MNNNTQNIESWNKFFEFDDIFSQKKNSILDIYPEWEKFLPES